MRFIPALLFCLVAISSLSFAAPDEGLPLSLNDLKLQDMGWKFPLSEYVADASLEWCEIDGPEFFVLDSKHTLHCLDLARGTHKWILNLDEKPTQAPALGEDRIAVAIKDRMVIADRKNGARIMDRPIKALATTSPAVSTNDVYVSVYVQNRLHAVDGRSGTTGWSYRFKDYIAAAPKIFGKDAERYLYAAAFDGAVICLPVRPALEAAPGKPAWVFQANGPITAGLTFSGTDLFVACEDSGLYCLNRLTGGIKWKYHAGVALKQAAQVNGEMLFLPTAREFVCLDMATGRKKWTFEKGRKLMAVVKGIAYVMTEDHSLALLNPETGELLTEVGLDDSLCMVPNMSSEMLIVVSGTEVFALK